MSVRARDVAALYDRGNALLARRRLEAAIAIYDQCLAIDSGHVGALVGRGSALAALRHHEAAIASYDKALAIDPEHVDAHSGRGISLANLRRYEEAIAAFDRVLALRSGHADTFNNKGAALAGLKRHAQAAENFGKALKVDPNRVEWLDNYGASQLALGRYNDALDAFDQALAVNPSYAAALAHRGDALQALNRHEEAIASYEKALVLKPRLVAALNGRGVTLIKLRRHADAIASFDKALAIAPRHAKTHYHRGMALVGLGRHKDAIASYESALEIAPGLVKAWNNLGTVLAKLGRHEDAIAAYDKALVLDPNYVHALYNRGNSHQALKRYADAVSDFDRVLAFDPDFEYAPGSAAYCRTRLCDWKNRSDVEWRITEKVRNGARAIRPFPFLVISSSPADQLACARIFVRDKRPAAAPMRAGERYRHDRIRLAYLSADFHSHATAFLMAGLFEHHDRARFETIAVSFGPESRGQMRSRLRQAFDRFIDARAKSDREIAAELRELEIDIAVDLKGFTTDNRMSILAHRPAPIQVNYLGYPGTMAAADIDYILADRVVIPPEHHPYYTEKVVYLPDCYQVNDSKRPITQRTPTRAEVGLPEPGFVFCSFNNPYKINPTTFDVWMRLLRRVEGGVLWLLKADEAVAHNLRHEAAERGIAPERLVFAERAKLPDHLARHRLADLFVDTLPYNAHTTASDALWAGLPVLTCLGSTFAGRVAASLLHAIGLPELITSSLHDYEALALKLAADSTLLGQIKSRLLRNRTTTPLFDTARFTRHIEAAYAIMWETQQRGDPPKTFSVSAGEA